MVSFSVIVPTFCEEKFLPMLLASLKRQTLQDFEVIVIDGGSKDGTLEAAGAWAGRLKIRIMVDGKPEFPSCNIAAGKAEGPTLIFTGADAIWPPEALETIARVMEQNNLDGAYCPVFPYDGPMWSKLEFSAWYAITFMWFRLTGEANACTAFFAVRKKVFEAVNGFSDVYGGDSCLSRLLTQKRYRVRPVMSIRVPISGRKMRKGVRRFNQHQITVLVDVLFWFLRSSSWLKKEKNRLHTDGYQKIR